MTDVVKQPSIVDQPAAEPQLGEESQFARQRGLRFGTLAVQKDKLEFNDGSQVTLGISAGGIRGYGTTGSTFAFYDSFGGTLKGIMGYLHSVTAMFFGSEVDTSISADNDLYLTADFDDSASGEVKLMGADQGSANSSGVFLYNHDTSTYTEKTAILPTSKGYRALYCTESPDVWFMDFCNAKKKRKWPKFWEFHWDVKIDSLFEEVTTKPYIVMPTVHKNIVQVWAKRKGQEGKRFEKKTKKEFEANDAFWSQAKKVKK